jgi:RNA polymerase sigma factor (sigma-70 family)
VNEVRPGGIHETPMIATQDADRTGSSPDQAAGVPLGFQEFFEAEHARLYRALALLTGDCHEAEDVMQEAFARVWERWDRVRAMDDPVGYLYRTALNGFRLRLRRAATAARRVVASGTRSDADPFAAVEDREVLRRALTALTLRQRTALVLTGVLGLTSEEAGRLMRASPVTVRRLAEKGRDAMRRTLEDDDA